MFSSSEFLKEIKASQMFNKLKVPMYINFLENTIKSYIHKLRVSQVLSDKESACQCRRHGFYPWVGRFPGWGNGNPLQFSWLENPIDREACGLPSMGSQKSLTGLSELSTHTWTSSRWMKITSNGEITI